MAASFAAGVRSDPPAAICTELAENISTLLQKMIAKAIVSSHSFGSALHARGAWPKRMAARLGVRSRVRLRLLGHLKSQDCFIVARSGHF